ncbi:dna mismatch repair protein [Stylonychia lemnae]|uniref:Dna mismatch repair protein n=1 Tax=Stylonychia lemnae TaxID=5949 RepID=A0A078AMB8_STYLE|nr:dna mismatch repair protein [Stylonychia lemnae]|eukprot:CDW81993.1 dna mismatch repair protein [Stylonychia lemnae]
MSDSTKYQTVVSQGAVYIKKIEVPKSTENVPNYRKVKVDKKVVYLETNVYIFQTFYGKDINWDDDQGVDIELQGLSSIASVTENRGNEIGIAIYTPFKNRIALVQMLDTALYSYTSMVLIGQAQPYIISTYLVDRNQYNEYEGEDLLSDFLDKNQKEIDKCPSNYVSNTCLSALILHLDLRYKVSIDKFNTKLIFHTLNNTLYIDHITNQLLYLTQNDQSQFIEGEISLLSLFKPMTILGKKLLRKIIISPTCKAAKLNYLYDILEKMMGSKDICRTLYQILKNLNCFESSFVQVVYVMKKYTINRPSTFLGNLIRFVNRMKRCFRLMKYIQERIPCMKVQLDKIDTNNLSEFLQLIESYFNVDDPIDNVEEEKTGENFFKKIPKNQQQNRGRVGLEIIKKLRYNPNSKIGFQAALALKLNTEVQEYTRLVIKKIEERFGIMGLKMKQDSQIGWYISIKQEDYHENQPLFKDYQAKTLKQSYQMVDSSMLMEQQIFTRIRKCQNDITRLFSLIARVDVQLCYATYLRELNIQYSRPVILEHSLSCKISPFLYVEQAKHPLFLKFYGDFKKFSQLDVKLNSLASKVCLIEGKNGSGKTTYMKMIQTILVLAQIGCFVPCSRFIYTPLKAIFCRAGVIDSIEKGESSFIHELQEIGVVINQISQYRKNEVMIFFDELGINTSLEQGFPLMWSICEHLLQMKNVVSVISTHNQLMNELMKTYKCVTILQLKLLPDLKDRLKFHHHVEAIDLFNQTESKDQTQPLQDQSNPEQDDEGRNQVENGNLPSEYFNPNFYKLLQQNQKIIQKHFEKSIFYSSDNLAPNKYTQEKIQKEIAARKAINRVADFFINFDNKKLRDEIAVEMKNYLYSQK